MKILIKLLLTSIFFTTVYGTTFNSYETNKEYRLKEIQKIIQKEKQIVSMVENYIFLTGDVDISTEKLIKFFKLSPDFFKGIKNNITLKIENGLLVIENELESNKKISKEILNLYNKYKNKNYNSYIKDNKVYIQLSENSKKAINFIKTLPEDYKVINSSNKNNIEKTEKKLEYNGNGFKISKYDNKNNKWIDLGYFDFNNKKGIIVNNEKDLLSLGKIKNISAFVLNENSVKELKYSKKGWQPVTSKGGDFFIGDGTIFDAACKIYNYDGGSEITINPDKEPYINSIEKFVRVDVEGENGYWINDNKNILIIKDIEDIKYRYNYNNAVNQMFICSPNKLSYYILRNEYVGNVKQWVIRLKTMEDMLNFNGEYLSNQWFFVENNNIYFQKTGNIFYSKYKLVYNNFVPFEDYIVGAGTRDIFKGIILQNNKTYLTTLDDCTEKKNCSGSLPTVFGGEKVDGLYKWSNVNGELQDVAISNLANAYNYGYTYFYDRTKNTYFKKVIDNNGNFCYKNVNDNFIYMKNSIILDNEFITGDGKIIFPLSNINCKNNLENRFDKGTFKNYMNINKFVKYLRLDNLNELSNWNTNSYIKNVIVNNKLFTYIDGQWNSYDTVFAVGDRNNIKNFENGIDKLFYTTKLGNGDTYNNGFLDKNTNLYVWEYNPNADKQLNGFIDIFKVDNMNEAYSNLSKFYSDIFIGNKKYYKIQVYDNNRYITYCIKDKDNNYYNGENKIIPNNYIIENQILFPKNKTCMNVNIVNNKIIINSLEDIRDLNYSNVVYDFYGKEAKILSKNNLEYDNKYIVIGDRNNFDLDTFNKYNFNFLNVYTTNDDSNKNKKIDIINNDRVYKWEYYSNIKGLGSINKLVETFKPTNCMDIYTVLGENGIKTIYDNEGKSWEVECNEGKTIFKLSQLKELISIKNLNSDSRYSFNKEEIEYTFFNNSNNEIVMNIDIPINFNNFSIENFSFSDNMKEAHFLSGYNVSNLHTENYYEIIKYINNKIKEFFNLSSEDTNYISIGLLNDKGDVLDEIGIIDNKEKITFKDTFYNNDNSNSIIIEILFNNKDNTTNKIKLNKTTRFVLY